MEDNQVSIRRCKSDIHVCGISKEIKNKLKGPSFLVLTRHNWGVYLKSL